MDELVEAAKTFNPTLQAKVIISRSSTNPSVHETKDTCSLLEDFSNLGLVNSFVCDRIAYRKAAKDGLSVVELRPKDVKASEEMELFYQEVFGNE